MIRTIFSVTIMSFVVAASASAADGWGSVSGQIIWKGDVPEPVIRFKKDAIIKDPEVCAADDVYKDDLIVDKDTKGIANIFVYLPKAPKKINPELKDFDAQIVFDQKNCIFKPHSLLVRAGQSVEVLNSDPISHNTHTYPIRNKGENLVISGNKAAGKGTLYSMKSRESLPIQVKCDFHTWMSANWLILDHPYAAITQADGSFEIKDLPAGTHKFRIWHERVGYLERKLTVKVKAGETTELKPLEYEIIEK
jgi:plastocyanin